MPPLGDSGGFLLSLVTESFAVRALLGSLAAALLAALVVRLGLVRTRRARRAVLLTPVLSAAVAGIASIGEVYLPQLWVAAPTGMPPGTMLDLFGEQRALVTDRGLDILVITYSLVAAVLLTRRVAGFVSVRRTLRRATGLGPEDPLARTTAQVAATMRVAQPRVLLLERCPGGAFTTGLRRPVVALDPELLDTLDEQELEGLLAHELAHIARHDTFLTALVGVFRDLSFFLPPLHAAMRWLRREQEEGADELASLHTGRPVALASSILKVWDCSRDRRHLAAACAAVSAPPSGVVIGRSTGAAARVIAARVERLISSAPAPSRLRQHAELAIAMAVLATGTAAALTIPAWIATDLDGDLTFLFLAAAPEERVESPAFTTFRALTPADDTEAAMTPAPVARRSVGHQGAAGCPCVESQAQLRQAEPAVSSATPRLAWGSDELPAWAMVSRYEDAVVRTARPVFALTDSGPQVGLFLVSRQSG